MVVRETIDRTQIAVLEDNVVVEHYVARSEESSLIGNVYLGRVQNVLPSMEAAFVDIGRGRNAVLYSGEVDWEAAAEGGATGPRRIELALKTGDTVLVQVTKDPVGHKGARLTSQISLPGRYLVYVPGGAMNGISRKLPDKERTRLKAILKQVLPESAGVIVRTAAEGATEEQLTGDVERLQKQWAELSVQAEKGQAPALLHSEPDLLVKIIRDVFNEDFQKIVISGSHASKTIENYLTQVAPDLIARMEAYASDADPFVEYRVNEGIAKALDRKVWLPSGGSLVIDRTEAMTVVDVNTGKFVGSGGNLEETVTKNNLEAAEEIVRQLRLRDIGGIIVVDFIDMVLESNRDLVLQRLMECLGRDRTKHQVAEVTSLGLVQMTRKKLGLGLLETFSESCEICQGRGLIVHHEPVSRSKSESAPAKKRKSSGSSQPSVAPHQITDDARNAIAQIAKSTVGHTTPAAPKADKPAAATTRRAKKPAAENPEMLDSVLAALPEAQRLGRPSGGAEQRADNEFFQLWKIPFSMRRLVPLALLLALVGLIALRSWTSDNMAPFRGQLQDVITLALSLLIESLPFIVLGIALSIVVQGVRSTLLAGELGFRRIRLPGARLCHCLGCFCRSANAGMFRLPAGSWGAATGWVTLSPSSLQPPM